MDQVKVDERVAELLEHEDIDTWDLRVNNQGRPEQFDIFLELCKQYIDEIPYYSTRHEPLCFYCSSEKDLAESEVGKHPICNLCLFENKKPTASRKRKKH